MNNKEARSLGVNRMQYLPERSIEELEVLCDEVGVYLPTIKHQYKNLSEDKQKEFLMYKIRSVLSSGTFADTYIRFARKMDELRAN